MSARLYSNETFDRRVVEHLRARGHDVLTSLEAGRANQRIPDDEVLEFATREDRAVLTFNRLHFMRLHRSTNAEHKGVIICTLDPDTQALARKIDQSIRAEGTLSRQLLRVNRPVQ